jgi:hypothetical protein
MREGGGSRGRDFIPVELFATDVNGKINPGIIKRECLANRRDFNIELVSFGWLCVGAIDDDWTPRHGVCSSFTMRELEIVQSLVWQAVRVWRDYEDDSKPSFLIESPESHFMGEASFRDGWALIHQDASS